MPGWALLVYMSPDKQRIAIAEACGWRAAGYYWLPPEHDFWLNVLRDKNGLPEFLSDLNAMHESEKTLTGEQRHKYIEELEEFGPLGPVKVCDYIYSVATATATQRAEAFLRTIGKWEDA